MFSMLLHVVFVELRVVEILVARSPLVLAMRAMGMLMLAVHRRLHATPLLCVLPPCAAGRSCCGGHERGECCRGHGW